MDTEKPKKTLVLNKKISTTSDAGHVRQSFSHGRTKTVTVEVKKRRGVKKQEDDQDSLSKAALQTGVLGGELAVSVDGQDGLKTLTSRELELRLQVLKDAKQRRIDEEIALQELENSLAAKEQNEINDLGDGTCLTDDGVDPPHVEQAEDLAVEPDVSVNNAVNPDNLKTAVKHDKFIQPFRSGGFDDSDDSGESRFKNVGKKPAKKLSKDGDSFGGHSRRQKKVSIYDAMAEEQERIRSLAAVRRARNKGKKGFVNDLDESKKIIREVVIPETIDVQELSNRMAMRGGELIKTLFKMGVVATINQVIDGDTAELVVTELGHKVKRVSDSDVEVGLHGVEDSLSDLLPRPPVVTVMGHVDHGKTSLLDALRRTDVVAKEAGGITQHIGAYQVTMSDGRKITFIDTPGHAAFTEMRVRGANVTDVVVLVVAADDSVKEQTIEAINHAKAANVPIVVAINKIDKPNVNPDRVKQDLLRYEIISESLGGDVVTVDVSAKTGKGLDELSEAILVQAEMLDLRANPNRSCDGVVIESRQEKGLGPVATILVKRGTLKRGEVFVSGNFAGRVRTMTDYLGSKIDLATPGMPVEVVGFDGTPNPGSDFIVLEDDAKAREIAQYRDKKSRSAKYAVGKVSVEQMFSDLKSEGDMSELPIIVKADVQGSVEAIIFSLKKVCNDEVAIRVLHSGVGEITESDIILAKASGGIVVGFNVRASAQARNVAQRDAVEVKYYSIIYDLVDDITAMLSGLLAPELREKNLGSAQVRKVFDVKKAGKIAGCMVVSGVIKRGCKVRVLRDNVVIHNGDLSSLMRLKDEVKEVREGFECGVGIENYQDIRESDIIECFSIEEIKRTL